MFIYVLGVLAVVGFCFVYSQFAKKSAVKKYTENYDTYLKREQESLKEVKAIIKPIQPDLEGKTIVNGQYITGIDFIVKVTTYYSYLLILDESANGVQVISYHPETKEATDCGYFTKERIEPVDLHQGAQTNYKFLDENLKEKFVVQTFGLISEEMYNSEYELRYPQLISYSKLRSFFDLATDLEPLKGM